ncbi:hypothetical protein LAZ67_3004739 [Cordylochernes scorpioides]|uniref:Prolactin receptor n=1 Tax=Cordylochernes scorpioides TaxID=51811 RepID=A0ABY6K9Y9_9ARAC|nr:hypothetical protein LAZ67_3004739 [Cordylochernes scorpioides]
MDGDVLRIDTDKIPWKQLVERRRHCSRRQRALTTSRAEALFFLNEGNVNQIWYRRSKWRAAWSRLVCVQQEHPQGAPACPSEDQSCEDNLHVCDPANSTDNSYPLQHGADDKSIELKQINSTVSRMEGIKPPAEFVPYSNEKKMGNLERVV